jgi:Flp pilus assembly protein TadD
MFLGFGAATGWLADWLAEASAWLRLVARAALAIVVLSLAADTVLRNLAWSSPVAIWRESVDLAPTHYRPRLLLGEALADVGRRTDAIEEFKTAIRLRPTDPTGHVKLGESLADMGDLPAARQHFLEALRLDPQNASARVLLTVLDKMESQPESNGPRR